MIPRIHFAELVQEDMWMIYIQDPDEPRFPIVRLIPVDYPKMCLGGAWCEDFGCTPGDNVFTRAETEILLEEGMELPEDWEAPWGEYNPETDSNDWVSE